MSRIQYMITILITNFIGYLSVGFIQKFDDAGFVFCSLLSLVTIIVQLYALKRYVGSLLTPYPIFLISFAIFNFGLFWLYGLGINFNYFYLNTFSSEQQIHGISYEMLCSGAMFLAGASCKTMAPFKMTSIYSRQDSAIAKVAYKGLFVSSIVAFVLLLFKARAFAGGLYEGVRQFEGKIPTYVSIVEYFFVPFAVLYMVYTDKPVSKKKTMLILVLWSIVTALLGDRTSGIGGIMVAILLNFKYSKYGTGNITKKNYVYLSLCVAAALMLISFAGSFRENTETGTTPIITSVIGEMGGSFFPLLLVMDICPFPHPYLMGSSYLFTLLTGFIPESLDFTGFVHQGLNYVIEPVRWIENDFDYTFGTGYSLCAESYANFGYWGFIALYFIGLAIIKVIQVDTTKKFSIYTSMVMLFELFTLPRRNCYYILNHSFYCILVIAAFILITTRSDNYRQEIQHN